MVQKPKKPQPPQYPEDLCRRCGLCCREKVWLDEHLYALPFFCEYIDIDTMLCTRYADRFTLDVECLTVAQGLKERAFPAGCPYVVNRPDYVPAREDWAECEDILQLIQDGELP